MKLHIFHSIALLLFLCIGVSSCREQEIGTPEYTKYIELKVSCVNLKETRALKAGEDPYNENKIESLHYFLYPSGMTDKNAVLAGKIEQDKLNGSSIQIPLNEGILDEELIPYPSITCEVFLVANLPSGVANTININTREHTKLAELKEKVVTANFTSKTEPFITQSSFVMTGSGTAELLSRKDPNAARGTIELKRLAAKYTVRISVDNTFTDVNEDIWDANIDGMTVHVANAVKETNLSGNYGNDYFEYDDRGKLDDTFTDPEDSKLKYLFKPFYSYPCQWELHDENAFVLYVMLPWKKRGETKYEHCYYKVLPNTTQLDRNCWYNVDLHIGVLGSFNPTEQAVALTGTFSVMDWNNGSSDWKTGVDEQTTIQGAQYLIVDKNHYVVNNQDEFEIPFRTSHPCKIKDLAITRTVFGDSNDDKPEESPITTSEVTENIHYQIGSNTNDWLKLEGNTIKLSHALKNDFINTKDYDYSPYTIKFTLCHINNEKKFYENITIIQKPALCITAYENSGHEKFNSGTDGYKQGYQFVNGTMANQSGTGDYGGAKGFYQTNTTNPYMYVIEVSVLPAGSNFILGDPRVAYNSTSVGVTLSTGNFVTALEINNITDESKKRSLNNYYITNTDDSYQNMIAPKFRISSSYSTVQNWLTYTNAFNRSATYQEDGYPAGRWRVPTLAEIQFMAKLYVDGYIPPLFSNSVDYWCANGLVDVNNGKVTFTKTTSGNSFTSVRPVYDEWYWEHSRWPRLSEDDYGKFTWGDEAP